MDIRDVYLPKNAIYWAISMGVVANSLLRWLVCRSASWTNEKAPHLKRSFHSTGWGVRLGSIHTFPGPLVCFFWVYLGDFKPQFWPRSTQCSCPLLVIYLPPARLPGIWAVRMGFPSYSIQLPNKLSSITQSAVSEDSCNLVSFQHIATCFLQPSCCVVLSWISILM